MHILLMHIYNISDNTLGYKASLKNFQELGSIQIRSSDHSTIQLEVSNNKKTRRFGTPKPHLKIIHDPKKGL